MHKMPEKCPVCGGGYFIRRVECKECRSALEGEFGLPVSALELDEETINFIKVFLYTEGSIRQTERMLNCSYPKVKNLLKKTKAALGVTPEAGDEGTDVLDLLDKGEIDVEEALEKIKKG